MDYPTSIENVPFVWGIAFVINAVLGSICLLLSLRKVANQYNQFIIAWIGWWSWASALSLMVNTIAGPSNPFSYHQMGIVTESMMNLGVIAATIRYVLYDSK